MKIGDIVEMNGKKYVVENITTYDFGTYPNIRYIGESTPTVVKTPEKEITTADVNYEDMSLKDLQELCKQRGLTIRGSKADVIERLQR